MGDSHAVVGISVTARFRGSSLGSALSIAMCVLAAFVSRWDPPPHPPALGGARDWDKPAFGLQPGGSRLSGWGGSGKFSKAKRMSLLPVHQPGSGGCARPPWSTATPGHLRDHPLSLFGFLECRDAMHWGWRLGV